MYTTDQLRRDLELLNPKLNVVRPGAMFTVQGRVGYLGLAVLNKGRFDNTIIEGSAAECFNAANQYIVDHMDVSGLVPVKEYHYGARMLDEDGVTVIYAESECAKFFGVYLKDVAFGDVWQFDCTDERSARFAIALLNR